MVEKDPRTGKVSYSHPSRGHCVSISKFGLAVSFVGARLQVEDFASTGRMLFVSVVLPGGPIDVIVTTITHDRLVDERGKSRWLVGASITHLSDSDRERLSIYLDARTQEEHLPPAE